MFSKFLSRHTLFLALGTVAFRTKHYDLALKYFQDSREMDEKLPEHTIYLKWCKNHNLAYDYSDLGNIYRHKGNFKEALKHFKIALDIRKRLQNDDEYQPLIIGFERFHDHPDMADLLINIGNLHQDLGTYQDALTEYKKALAIKKRFLQSTDSEIGSIHLNIGCTYLKMRDNDLALKSLRKAKRIYSQSVVSTHPDIIQTEENIRMAEMCKKYVL
jgi:tetratricopeptide (TPR) repeat protein